MIRVGKEEHRSAVFNISHQIPWFMIVVLSGFSTVKFLLSPFHIVLCGRKPLCRTHIWGVWGNVLLLRGHRIYINYLEFYKGDIPYPPFIHLIGHLICMDSYLFYGLGYNPILYFVAQIVSASLLSFSRLILYVFSPVLEQAIFPRSPGPFYWRMVLGTKTWVLGVFFPAGVSFLLGPFSWQHGNICVH